MSSPVDALLVDARPVDHPTARQRGIGRYVTGLLRGLHEIGAPLVALHGSDVDAEVLADASPGLNLRRWSPQAIRDHVAPGTWYVATQLMLHPIPLDPIPSMITRAHLPVAAVMYDVIPYRFPDRYQVEPNARRQAPLRASLARTADAMLAISQFAARTAADELDYPIERIRSIGAGVEHQFVASPIRPRPDRVLPPPVDRYVVSVTGGDERKNTEGLLRAWGRVDPAIRRGRHLVIATAHSPAVLRRWESWAADAGVAAEVVFTGGLTDDEMVAVLQHAELAVMPSTEEGFGLPVVEAAACGTPVICSNVSSLPEVLEEPAAEFDPFDPAAIARAIEQALTDAPHREALLAAGRRAAERWTWPRVAEQAIEAIRDLGPRWPQRLLVPEPRIAIAGPFAGSASGIGRYDESVVAAIEQRRADHPSTPHVEVFVDTSGSAEPTDASSARLPVRAIGRYAKPWDVDHLVAVLGSSPHHAATAELALEQPCHVWLHEASLVGVHVGLAHLGGNESWAVRRVRDRLERDEAPELQARVGDDALLDAARLDELGVTFLRETLERARSVIVSSEQAAVTVRRIRPVGPPMLILPLGHPPAVAPTHTPPRGDIVAVGWLAPNKSPALAIDVLSLLPPDVTLTFVGPSSGDTADEVRRLAEHVGVHERVAFTGRLDDDEYAARIAGSRIGLQLRSGDRGEMSAAVTDLLAHGIPTVTTLTTAGPSTPGLRVVEAAPAALVSAIEPLLADDEWERSSADALARAGRWTFDHVAEAVLAWLDDAADLPPATVRRVGAASVSAAP